jgi:hypothetical protein
MGTGSIQCTMHNAQFTIHNWESRGRWQSSRIRRIGRIARDLPSRIGRYCRRGRWQSSRKPTGGLRETYPASLRAVGKSSATGSRRVSELLEPNCHPPLRCPGLCAPTMSWVVRPYDVLGCAPLRCPVFPTISWVPCPDIRPQLTDIAHRRPLFTLSSSLFPI